MAVEGTYTIPYPDNDAYTSVGKKRIYKHPFVSHSLQYRNPQKQEEYESQAILPGGLLELLRTADSQRTKVLYDFATREILDSNVQSYSPFLALPYPNNRSVTGILDPSFDLHLDAAPPPQFHPRRLNAARALDIYYRQVEVPKMRDALHWFDHVARYQYPHLIRAPPNLQQEPERTHPWAKEQSNQRIHVTDDNGNINYLHTRNPNHEQLQEIGSEFGNTKIDVYLNVDQPNEKFVKIRSLPKTAQRMVGHLLNVEDQERRHHLEDSAGWEGGRQHGYTLRLRYTLQLDNHNIWTPYEVARLETLYPILKLHSDHYDAFWQNPQTESRVEDIVEIKRTGGEQISTGAQILDFYMGHVLYGRK